MIFDSDYQYSNELQFFLWDPNCTSITHTHSQTLLFQKYWAVSASLSAMAHYTYLHTVLISILRLRFMQPNNYASQTFILTHDPTTIISFLIIGKEWWWGVMEGTVWHRVSSPSRSFSPSLFLRFSSPPWSVADEWSWTASVWTTRFLRELVMNGRSGRCFYYGEARSGRCFYYSEARRETRRHPNSRILFCTPVLCLRADVPPRIHLGLSEKMNSCD